MKLLVIGSGAREHALVRALARGRHVSSISCAPGNAGIARDADVIAIDAGNVDALVALADRERFDLTVVGPELPLDRGVVDRFRERGHRIFGPSRAAAQLECSKAFAKSFMSRHGIPTARYRVCERASDAYEIVARGEFGLPLVVKADGLAAGKGVVVAANRGEADAAIRAAMDDRQFGDAGSRVVIEEALSGPEVSFFALCDGRAAIPLGTAQDHKRVFDDDRGPNTGGMGAFAPSPLADANLERRVMTEVVEPLVRGMRDEGHEYRGFLYVGLMLTCDGPKVIEFNVRFGDPEAQVVLPLVESDLPQLLIAAAEGNVAGQTVRTSADVAVGVVLASAGYPSSVTAGFPIRGLDDAAQTPGVAVYHAATALADGALVTAGGRVLTVVGRGPTFADAIARAYEGVRHISFEGMQYRRDIGAKAVQARGA
ncbi:MAG TPA: phosphoribosylamine--glycine ligase [Vicinamibacterales bacterium]|nr:phosphoribosylamine--glycine ligase [Vicinamibacterales bacterium]